MADIEKEVEALIYASLGEPDSGDKVESAAATNEATDREQGIRNVIEVDLYRLPGGAVLLVPGEGANPLDAHAVESSVTASKTGEPEEQEISREKRTVPTPSEDTEESGGTGGAGVHLAPMHSRVKRSAILVLLCMLLFVAGAASYVFVLPLTATATVTLTPNTRSLQTQTTLTIATHPQGIQVQGRSLAAYSLTASEQVPATGHSHQDAARASGVITFYNADASPFTIPAGVSFIAWNGATVATDKAVTIQAAVPPAFGTAIAPAHVVQIGSLGNIPARAIDTRCCGSVFVTATNTTPFAGGQDARDYDFIQTSDIQRATTDLVGNLTPKVIAQLGREANPSESLVTPLCTPYRVSSGAPGAQAASVTVSVTQTCRSVAYGLDSLELTASTLLAHSQDMSAYQQVGTVQVTINGSTYTRQSARLNVTLSGLWVYRFSAQRLTHLIYLIAGESAEKAKQQLESEPGIRRVSIQVSRLDGKNALPSDPAHIHLVSFVISMS